jgi:hypothetical protein
MIPRSAPRGEGGGKGGRSGISKRDMAARIAMEAERIWIRLKLQRSGYGGFTRSAIAVADNTRSTDRILQV